VEKEPVIVVAKFTLLKKVEQALNRMVQGKLDHYKLFSGKITGMIIRPKDP